MRLELALAPSAISFTSTDGPYPFIVAVGSLRLAARSGDPSGDGANETASLVVSLNNAGNRVAGIVQVPLRVGAVVYDDDDNEFFAGTVSQVGYGRTVDLTIES